MRKSKYLTKRMYEVLKALADDVETDLVWEKGAGWWIGFHRTHGKTALALVRLCLVNEDSIARDGTYCRYDINEHGEAAIKDPDFVPPIVAHVPDLQRYARR